MSISWNMITSTNIIVKVAISVAKTRVVTTLLESTFPCIDFAIEQIKHLESSESVRFSELDGLSRVPRRLGRDPRGHGGRASQAL